MYPDEVSVSIRDGKDDNATNVLERVVRDSTPGRATVGRLLHHHSSVEIKIAFGTIGDRIGDMISTVSACLICKCNGRLSRDIDRCIICSFSSHTSPYASATPPLNCSVKSTWTRPFTSDFT